MRDLLRGGVALLLIVLLCLSVPLPSVVHAATTPATYSSQCPNTGGNLVIAIPGDPGSLQSATASDVNVGIAASPITEGLVWLDQNYVPQPLLAKSWTTSSDGLTVTFNLRNNATWHDGQKFTSADVAYSIMDVDRLYASFAVGPLSNVQNVTTPDDYTAVLHLQKPEPYLLQVLNAWYAPIIPKHIYFGTNTTGILQNPANNAPVGTGPFMFKSWTHGTNIVLVRNPNYWRAGLPCLDQVTFNIITSHPNAVTAFKSGQVDYVPWQELDFSLVASVQNATGATFYKTPNNIGQTVLWLNNRSPTMSKLAVRQAFAYALDGQFKKDLIHLVYSDQASVSDNPFASSIPAWYNPQANQSALYPQDINKANSLLDQAGYPKGPDGTRFTITLTTRSDIPAFVEGSKLVKDQLAKIGVTANIQALDQATYESTQFADRSKVNWDASFLQIGLSVDPAIGVAIQYLTSAIANGVAYSNIPNFSNSTVDKLLGDAAFNADSNARKQLYAQAQTALVQQSPAIWLVHAQFPGVSGNGYERVLPNLSLSLIADYATAYWKNGPVNSGGGGPAGGGGTTTTLGMDNTTLLLVGVGIVVVILLVGLALLRRRPRMTKPAA